MIEIKNSKLVETYCNICSKPIFSVPSRIKNGKGKFCSRICSDKSKLGKSVSPATQIKQGQRLSKATEFKKGNVSPLKLNPNLRKFGEKHPLWKGKDVSYVNLHKWVYRHLGRPKKCEFCGVEKKMMHWANKSGEYKRELSDWLRLCVSCHKNYDRK